MMMKRAIFIASMLVFSGCDQSGDKAAVDATAVNRGPVLAEVNGSKVYQQDLDVTLVDMFGEYQASQLDQQGRKKALESLVASRAMTDIALKELDRATLSSIEIKTQRYRENLIINNYVKEHITPEPVSNAMVEDYYRQHLDRFGQQTLREYEMISSKAVLTDAVRDRLLKAFDTVKDKTPSVIQGMLSEKGFQVDYHKGVTGDKVLAPRLRDFVNGQAVNALSNVTFIDGKAYVVRVNREIVQPAKPLREVSADIRRSLAVMQLKKAVKALSEKALEQARVEYR